MRFAEEVDAFNERGREQACIYARILVDKDGYPPYIEDVRVLLKELEAYVLHARTADDRHYKIDTMFDDDWSQDQSRAGDRRYFSESGSFRRKVVKVFCLALEQELRAKDRRGAKDKVCVFTRQRPQEFRSAADKPAGFLRAVFSLHRLRP